MDNATKHCVLLTKLIPAALYKINISMNTSDMILEMMSNDVK